MKKGFKGAIITLALVLFFCLGAFLGYKFTDDIFGGKVEENKTQTDNGNAAVEKRVSNGESNEENNRSSNDSNNDNDSGGEKNKKFSSEDLKVKGITFGSSTEEVVNVFGTDFESRSYTEDADGSTVTEMIFKNDNIMISAKTVIEDGVVDSIHFLKGSSLKTSRGIGLNDSRKDILKAYPSDSILKNDQSYVVVGYPGDNEEYESKGRIYFNMDDDTIVGINYEHTYAE